MLENWKTMKYESDSDTWNTNHGIVATGQNTEKRPGELRRFAINQTSVRNPLANASMKNYQKSIIIIIYNNNNNNNNITKSRPEDQT